MNAETIKNQIVLLGNYDFKRLIKMILSNVFNMSVINVDGTNDGGSDWLLLNRDGSIASIAFQDTTQANINEKIAQSHQFDRSIPVNLTA